MVFVVPYDGSVAAQMALVHLTCRIRQHGGSDQVLLALVVTRRHEPERRLAEARALAGPDVPLSFRLIPEDDLHGAFVRLGKAMPDATFVAPVGSSGPVDWYYVAVRNTLAGWFGRTLALHLRPERQRSGSMHTMPLSIVPFGAPRWGGCTLRSSSRRSASRFQVHPARSQGAGEG